MDDEKLLFEVAAAGDMQSLLQLIIQYDRRLLERFYFPCSNRNILHVAALKGQIVLLQYIILHHPELVEEVLHLAVKNNQLEVCKILVEFMSDLINEADADVNTILHVAARLKLDQIIEYLVGDPNTNVNATNSKGQAAIHIFEESRNKNTNITTRELEIKNMLKLRVFNCSHNARTPPEKWMAEKSNALMGLAGLIAAMEFSAAINPAGGVWQDYSDGDPLRGLGPHRPGEAVMSPDNMLYWIYLTSIAISIITSLSTILLLLSGLPYLGRIFMRTVIVAMWMAVSSCMLTLAIALTVNFPTLGGNVRSSMVAWACFMFLFVVGNIGRWWFLCFKWTC